MTRALLKLFLALGLFVSAANPLRAEMSAEELTTLASKVRGSVMFMMIEDDAGHTIGSGTGFIVSNDGKLITNRHVVNAGPRLMAKAPGGKTYKVSGVLAEDTDQDLVVLQIDDHTLPALTLGASEDVAAGTPVVIVGNPLAMESTVQQGTVAGFRKFLGAPRWIEINAAIASGNHDSEAHIIHGQGLQVVTSVAHGSSGSPVFNASGIVIGVIAAISHNDAGREITLAIPVEAIKDLLKRAERAEPKPLSEISRRRGNDLASDPEYIAAAKAYYANDYQGALPHAGSGRYPDSPAAYLLQGQIFLKRRAGREAGDAFERAIQKVENDLAAAWAGLCGWPTCSRISPAKLRDAYRRKLDKFDLRTGLLAKQVAVTAPALASLTSWANCCDSKFRREHATLGLNPVRRDGSTSPNCDKGHRGRDWR